MQVLANTAKEVQTNIGIGIIDALKLLSGDTTVENLANNMRSTSIYLQDVIVGVGTLGEKLKNIPVLGGLNVGMIPIVGSYIELLRASGKERREILTYNKNEHKAKERILAIDKKADKLTKNQVTAQNKLLATQKKIADEKKKQEVLDKASLLLAQGQKVFDEEGIQLAAAAQGKLTEEERTRLALKTDIYNLEAAINEGNITAAAQLANSMVANAQKLALLRTDMVGLNDIQNPFNAWLNTLQQMALELSKLANIKPTTVNQLSVPYGPATSPGGYSSNGSMLTFDPLYRAQAEALIAQRSGAQSSGSSVAAGSVIVNISGSVTTERDLVAAITQGLYSQQASGTPVNYSTAY
jgi:hypothetical protein